MHKLQKILDVILPFFITLGLVNSAFSLYIERYDNFLIAIVSVVIMALSPRLVKDDKDEK